MHIFRHLQKTRTRKRALFVSLVTASLFGSFSFGCRLPPDAGVRTSFRYNQHNPITSLDPAFARTQNNIWAVDCLFNGLLQLDDSLHVKPCIAKSWTISSDALTYRFVLRDDVFFHDDEAFPGGKGRRVLASDVVYSFKRLLDDTWPKPGSWIFKDRVAKDSALLPGTTVFSPCALTHPSSRCFRY